MKSCKDCEWHTKNTIDKNGKLLEHGCRIVTELHPVVGWYHADCFEHNADGECEFYREKIDYDWEYRKKRAEKALAFKEKLADAPWWKKPGVWWRG